MGVNFDISECDCCHGEHKRLDIFPGPIPDRFPVWGGFSRDNLWFLCPVFLYAVAVKSLRV